MHSNWQRPVFVKWKERMPYDAIRRAMSNFGEQSEFALSHPPSTTRFQRFGTAANAAS